MKILLVNTRHYRGGGDSTYTFNLADLLREAGHEVGFFAMEDEKSLADPNADLFVSHIDFKELNKRKTPGRMLKVAGRAIYSREARKKFGRMVDRFGPDLVHLQNIHAHLTPSVIVEAKKRKLPVVWTLHDYKLICPNSHFLIDGTGEICEACLSGGFYQAVLKRCKKGSLLASLMASCEAYVHRWMGVLAKVDVFLSPSAFLAGKMVEGGLPAQKVRHLPLFLPRTMFGQVPEDQEDGGYILFIGRLTRIKGVYPLLAASRLAPEVPLIMAGAADEPVLEDLPRELGPGAKYVGMKHGQELWRLLAEARAVVVPSLWFENQPFAITEAFAVGKPVITSNLGGMIELVKDRERGFLVPPGDVEALAGAMSWLADHPEKARQLGRKALEYVRAEHHPEIHYQRLMEAYRSARGQA